MRYPNKTYEIPDGRKMCVVLESDPINGSTVFRLDYEGAIMISFGYTGLQLEACDNQKKLNEDEFLLDIITYPWAVDWFAENNLAEPTGETRTWLKDIKYAFDTGNLTNWNESANPNSGIERYDYPVYKVNIAEIKKGE